VAQAGGTSRSLAIYGLLLQLYPGEYSRQHRAEMLQNFLDIEAAASSRVSLWTFIGKDLVVSLRSHFMRTLWGQTAIVLLVLAALIIGVRGHPVQQEHCIWGFCVGYLPGWFGGWLGKRWQAESVSNAPSWLRSFRGQGAIVLVVVALVLGVARECPKSLEHVLWVLAYGSLLGWVAGWLGKRRHARL
jgi:hypothetical protein